MQELHRLMEYINCYRYDKKEEEIVIVHSPYDEAAKEVYDKARRLCRQWYLDMAIDCVREMSENDRDYILHHMNSIKYHHGYAMGIRNEYIHCSAKHFTLMPDDDSTQVMKVIFSIIHPYYNHRDKNCTDYFESFEYGFLSDDYGDDQREVFEAVEEKLFAPDGGMTADDALKLLKGSLAAKLGKKEFKRIFTEFMKDYYENDWASADNDFHWKSRFPMKARLFPLEVKQASCLKDMGLFDDVRLRKIRSQEQCKQYIDENLSLDENSALFMAECIWEACTPSGT